MISEMETPGERDACEHRRRKKRRHLRSARPRGAQGPPRAISRGRADNWRRFSFGSLGWETRAGCGWRARARVRERGNREGEGDTLSLPLRPPPPRRSRAPPAARGASEGPSRRLGRSVRGFLALDLFADAPEGARRGLDTDRGALRGSRARGQFALEHHRHDCFWVGFDWFWELGGRGIRTRRVARGWRAAAALLLRCGGGVRLQAGWLDFFGCGGRRPSKVGVLPRLSPLARARKRKTLHQTRKQRDMPLAA